MQKCLLMCTETIRLTRDGEKRGGGMRGREIIHLSLQCHHQNDFCIKADSDESHFNVSFIVRDKVTRQCPHTTIIKKEDKKGLRCTSGGVYVPCIYSRAR